MSGTFWIASFPKSGNTWIRSFLCCLINQGRAVDINSLNVGRISSSLHWVEQALGVDIGELSDAEIDQLRPNAYRWIGENEALGYHKIHDAYTYQNGVPLLPAESVRGVVYLARNPLDIVISYANYNDKPIDWAIRYICDSEHGLEMGNKGRSLQLRQRLLSWSQHVESWLEADVVKLVVRYEDLHEKPEEYFSKISCFCEIDTSPREIKNAYNLCHFSNLRRQEELKGFIEKPMSTKAFFRKGRSGDWVNILTEKQIYQVIEHNYKGMKRMGYLDPNDRPIV